MKFNLNEIKETLMEQVCNTRNKYCKTFNPEGEFSYCSRCEAVITAFEDIESAVEWLLQKRVFKKCKGTLVNTELDEMYVFKKEDFEKAFEDVIK